MTIRPLRPADRGEFLRMRLLLWPDSTAGEVDALLASTNTAYVVLVAERMPDGLCGFAEVGLRDYAEGCDEGPVGYLEGIWVDPDARRAAVGRRLVRRGEAWAASHGCRQFASDCALGNEASAAFHRAVGFEEAARIVCFRREIGHGGRPQVT